MSAVNHCNFIDHSIKRWVVMAFLCGVGLYSLQAQTQDKDALTAKKEKIEAQLATTSRLIGEAKKNRNAVNSQMTLINRQIELRERLIRHHQSSIRILEKSVLKADTEIRSLEGHIEGLKEEYAMMIQQAYRMQLANNPLMFVFAAEDFSQAALRFRMLQSYAEVRKRQALEIADAQTSLTTSKELLSTEKTSVLVALEDQESERDALNGDRKERAKLVSEIKGEEARLGETLKAQEQEYKRLSNEIKRIIEAEIEAERASAAGEYALTPAGKIISEEFEKNKSRFPWPVARGVVTKEFGRHKHPTIAGITVESNGIDITTEQGTKVFSIFGGTVSSVFSFPGAGETVIITHGGYRTVYSNLESLEVSKGDVIARATRLGKAWTGPKGTTVHFEIWKTSGSERSPKDPKSWLHPR
jgi:septal ring factor EnvC (AmiA/AmiB activator)